MSTKQLIADNIKDDLDYVIENNVTYDDFYVPKVTAESPHNGIIIEVEFNPIYVSSCELISKLNSVISKYDKNAYFSPFVELEDFVILTTYVSI